MMRCLYLATIITILSCIEKTSAFDTYCDHDTNIAIKEATRNIFRQFDNNSKKN